MDNNVQRKKSVIPWVFAVGTAVLIGIIVFLCLSLKNTKESYEAELASCHEQIAEFKAQKSEFLSTLDELEDCLDSAESAIEELNEKQKKNSEIVEQLKNLMADNELYKERLSALTVELQKLIDKSSTIDSKDALDDYIDSLIKVLDDINGLLCTE